MKRDDTAGGGGQGARRGTRQGAYRGPGGHPGRARGSSIQPRTSREGGRWGTGADPRPVSRRTDLNPIEGKKFAHKQK